MLTAYDGDEDIYCGLQAGAQSFLLKGVSFDELLATIHSVHAAARRIHTALADGVIGKTLRRPSAKNYDATGNFPPSLKSKPLSLHETAQRE